MHRKILALFAFAALTASAQQPQTQTAPIYSANSKYVQGVGPGYWPTAGSGLTLNLSAGTANCAGTVQIYAGGTVAMATSATNFVYLDPGSNCVPASTTHGFNFVLGSIPIATVATTGSVITGITDDRTFQQTIAGQYLPLGGGTMTGALNSTYSGLNSWAGSMLWNANLFQFSSVPIQNMVGANGEWNWGINGGTASCAPGNNQQAGWFLAQMGAQATIGFPGDLDIINVNTWQPCVSIGTAVTVGATTIVTGSSLPATATNMRLGNPANANVEWCIITAGAGTTSLTVSTCNNGFVSGTGALYAHATSEFARDAGDQAYWPTVGIDANSQDPNVELQVAGNPTNNPAMGGIGIYGVGVGANSGTGRAFFVNKVGAGGVNGQAAADQFTIDSDYSIRSQTSATSYTCSITTNGTTTITSSTPCFHWNDIGIVLVNGTGIPTQDYIKGYTSSTSATLNAAATGSGTITATLSKPSFGITTNELIPEFGLYTIGGNYFGSFAGNLNVGAYANAAVTTPSTVPTGTVFSATNNAGSDARISTAAWAAIARFTSVRYDGTLASPTAVQSGEELGSINAYAYNGTALQGPIAAFRSYANQNQAVGSAGSYADVATTANGSTTEAEVMRFENDGGVTVPSTVPGGDKGPGTVNTGGTYIDGVPPGGVQTSIPGDLACAHAADTTIGAKNITGGSSTSSAVTISTANTAFAYVSQLINITGYVGANNTLTAQLLPVTAVTLNSSITASTNDNPGAWSSGGTWSLACRNQVQDAIVGNLYSFASQPTPPIAAPFATFTQSHTEAQFAQFSSSTASTLGQFRLYFGGDEFFGNNSVPAAVNSLSGQTGMFSWATNVISYTAPSALMTTAMLQPTFGSTSGPNAFLSTVSNPAFLNIAGSHPMIFEVGFTAGSIASGTYTSGGSITGSATQTCTLTSFNNGSTATATVALTGTNAIAGGTALNITAIGQGATAPSTSATLGNGTATCSGTAVIATVTEGTPGNAILLNALTWRPN